MGLIIDNENTSAHPGYPLVIAEHSASDHVGLCVSTSLPRHSVTIYHCNLDGGPGDPSGAPYFFLAPGHIGVCNFSSCFTIIAGAYNKKYFEVDGYNDSITCMENYTFSASDWGKLKAYCQSH